MNCSDYKRGKGFVPCRAFLISVPLSRKEVVEACGRIQKLWKLVESCGRFLKLWTVVESCGRLFIKLDSNISRFVL